MTIVEKTSGGPVLASARSACPDPTVSGVGTAYLCHTTLNIDTVYMGHPMVSTWELKRAIFLITNARRLSYQRQEVSQTLDSNDLGAVECKSIHYVSQQPRATRRIVAPTVFLDAASLYHRLIAKHRHSTTRTSTMGDSTTRTTHTINIRRTPA